MTAVKKWFRDKEYGFLDNGEGPDIMVRKADLLNCQFLKVGVQVEFECHPGKTGLIAKKVKLKKETGGNPNGGNGQGHDNRGNKQPFRFGVMR
nr:cold shock domain-containing protein [Dasania marina]